MIVKRVKSFSIALIVLCWSCIIFGESQFQRSIDFNLDTGRRADATKLDKNDYKKAVRKNHPFTKVALSPIDPVELVDFLVFLYEDTVPAVVEKDGKPRIPKIIHQIWLGSEFPDKYRSWRQTWLDKHPDWVYILWTDNSKNYFMGDFVESEEELKLILKSENCSGKRLVFDVSRMDMVNRESFLQAPNYGSKSSILRYEILYRYGGVYLDTDLECFRSFDPLVYGYDFFAGMAPINMQKTQVANGLIGSIPGHSVLQYCIKNTSLDRFNNKIVDILQSTVAATGPGFLTRAIFYAAGKGDTKDVVLPPSYFYSLRREMLRLIYSRDESFPPKFFSDLPSSKFVAPPEAFAVHYWETSWMKKYK